MKEARRFVVKVGSTLVTNRGAGLDASAIARWAGQIATLRRSGKEVVLVSSGAIAEGMQRLGWTRRPHAMHELQAAAAVGQMGLVQVYESCFRQHGLHTAQVLLTHADLADRQRYLNARSTLLTQRVRCALSVSLAKAAGFTKWAASCSLRRGRRLSRRCAKMAVTYSSISNFTTFQIVSRAR